VHDHSPHYSERVRNRWGALILIAAMALVVIGLAAPAGAQVQVFSCSYSVDPTTLPATGGTVTVSGVAPGGSTVRVFTDGVLAATTQAAPVTGAFSAQVFITASVEISVALDGYPTTPCIGVGGESVDQDGNGNGNGSNGIIVGGVSTVRRNLAYTGSSDTKPFVLLGLGAVCVGLVLVVAARRRTRIHGRD
jgi:LPXTG-motif cell wall-anchored protein